MIDFHSYRNNLKAEPRNLSFQLPGQTRRRHWCNNKRAVLTSHNTGMADKGVGAGVALSKFW